MGPFMWFQHFNTSTLQTASFQDSIRVHCRRARMITLAISAEAKVSKAPHASDFQVKKSIIFRLREPAGCALERLNPPKAP